MCRSCGAETLRFRGSTSCGVRSRKWSTAETKKKNIAYHSLLAFGAIAIGVSWTEPRRCKPPVEAPRVIDLAGWRQPRLYRNGKRQKLHQVSLQDQQRNTLHIVAYIQLLRRKRIYKTEQKRMAGCTRASPARQAAPHPQQSLSVLASSEFTKRLTKDGVPKVHAIRFHVHLPGTDFSSKCTHGPICACVCPELFRDPWQALTRLVGLVSAKCATRRATPHPSPSSLDTTVRASLVVLGV